MAGRTFAEKVLGASAGSIVFREPDWTLTHTNTGSIAERFAEMGGKRVKHRERLIVVLDHEAPPGDCKLANSYKRIRRFVGEQGIKNFHDEGEGICHQIMSYYAKPGMIIAGADSHTCTVGAFNAFAAGFDRTTIAEIWRTGKTWFRVPETIKIRLHGELREGVSAKDLALWIIGRLGASGANYMSIEYHDEDRALSVDDRMVLANLASEMGAKNAAFPGEDIWADKDAHYAALQNIELDKIYPLVACPHNIDNIKSVTEVAGARIDYVLIGTCTNGRLDDLRIAAEIVKGRKIAERVRFNVVPASRKILSEALEEGIIKKLVDAGANILTPSCGPCLGRGLGIPADEDNVISSANRNTLGRMGNKKANIWLASPATAAMSALFGEITHPRIIGPAEEFPYKREAGDEILTASADSYRNGVWDYSRINDLNTGRMLDGDKTYGISSTEPEKFVSYLFEEFDPNFAKKVKKGDIILVGHDFGCGSSREHPPVGLAYLGMTVIVKSVSRIFYRAAVNQGLPVLIMPEVVNCYKPGDKIGVDFEKNAVLLHGSRGARKFALPPLPPELMAVLESGGLVNWIKKEAKE